MNFQSCDNASFLLEFNKLSARAEEGLRNTSSINITSSYLGSTKLTSKENFNGSIGIGLQKAFYLVKYNVVLSRLGGRRPRLTLDPSPVSHKPRTH